MSKTITEKEPEVASPWLRGTSEGAKYMKVSDRQARRWVAEKRIPHVRVGSIVMFNTAELDRWLAEHHVAVVPDHELLSGRR